MESFIEMKRHELVGCGLFPMIRDLGLTIARTDVSSLGSGNIFSFYSRASECRLRHEHMVPPAPRVEFTDYNVSSSGTSVMIMYNMLNSWYKLIWPSTRTDESMASRCHSVQMEHGQFEIIRKSKKIQLNFFHISPEFRRKWNLASIDILDISKTCL